MSEIVIYTKGCPLLAQKEEHIAMMVGHGDFTVSYLSPCIKEKCVAYKNGYCKHFNENVMGEEKKKQR